MHDPMNRHIGPYCEKPRHQRHHQGHHETDPYPRGARDLLPPPKQGQRWVFFAGTFGTGYIEVSAH